MKKIHYYLHFPVFLLFSALLGYYFQSLNQVHEYTIQSHSFHLKIWPFLVLCLAFLLFLLGLWLIYSKITAKLYSLKYSEALSRDFMTYLPIAFLLLSPFVSSHYLSSDDLLSRLKLFGIAILIAFFYLKIVGLLHWGKEKQSPLKNFASKLSSLSLKKN